MFNAVDTRERGRLGNGNGMWMLSDSEYHVLAKFRDGGDVVRDSDNYIVESLVSHGLLHAGLKRTSSPRSIRRTARLTPFGGRVLLREDEARGEKKPTPRVVGFN